MSKLYQIESNKAIVSWDLLANDMGDVYNLSGWTPASVTVEGILDGASVVIEGGNNPDTEIMFLLNDPNGYPLRFDIEKIEAVLEDCLKIRPRSIGGGSITKVTVCLLLSSTKPSRPVPARLIT